jgi:hypothetical protein
MFRLGALLLCLAVGPAFAAGADTDRDGLPDAFEQALLQKFVPRFHISQGDCDLAPAEFLPGSPGPRVKSRNGTVYGQVLPLPPRSGGAFAEIHFYHLWSKDCGLNGHDLDAESVYALLRAGTAEADPRDWRAEFWLAGAHEDTFCDVSNGAAAAAVEAVDRGPDVWVSRDKHASFLSKSLCSGGCGRDTCEDARPLAVSNLINLGEPGAPMNGAVWARSDVWRLASKMTPRYTASLLARMPGGSEVEIVPAREVVRGGRSTVRVAARTYGSLVAADTFAGEFVEAGVDGAGTGLNAARNSAEKAGRGMKAATSATRKWLKTRFEPQESR